MGSCGVLSLAIFSSPIVLGTFDGIIAIDVNPFIFSYPSFGLEHFVHIEHVLVTVIKPRSTCGQTPIGQ